MLLNYCITDVHDPYNMLPWIMGVYVADADGDEVMYDDGGFA